MWWRQKIDIIIQMDYAWMANKKNGTAQVSMGYKNAKQPIDSNTL